MRRTNRCLLVGHHSVSNCAPSWLHLLHLTEWKGLSMQIWRVELSRSILSRYSCLSACRAVLHRPKGAGRTLQVVTTQKDLSYGLFLAAQSIAPLRLQATLLLGQSCVQRSGSCRGSHCFGRGALKWCQSRFQMPSRVHHSCSPLQVACF